MLPGWCHRCFAGAVPRPTCRGNQSQRGLCSLSFRMNTGSLECGIMLPTHFCSPLEARPGGRRWEKEVGSLELPRTLSPRKRTSTVGSGSLVILCLKGQNSQRLLAKGMPDREEPHPEHLVQARRIKSGRFHFQGGSEGGAGRGDV